MKVLINNVVVSLWGLGHFNSHSYHLNYWPPFNTMFRCSDGDLINASSWSKTMRIIVEAEHFPIFRYGGCFSQVYLYFWSIFSALACKPFVGFKFWRMFVGGQSNFPQLCFLFLLFFSILFLLLFYFIYLLLSFFYFIYYLPPFSHQIDADLRERTFPFYCFWLCLFIG